MLKLAKDFNFQGKRVLLRCDFNIPLLEGKVLDNFRIKLALPTIDYLQKQKAKIILLSHIESGEKGQKKKETLFPVFRELGKELKQKIFFSQKCIGKKAEILSKKLKPGEILMLENLRQEPGEKNNDPQFASSLKRMGEVYISEAFSVCHRNHASVVLLPKTMPCFAGLAFEKEIAVLSKILEEPQRPLVVIIGGKKVGSKAAVISRFLKKADFVLVGGSIFNLILRVKGLSIGKIWPEEEVAAMLEKIDLTNIKLRLPFDCLVSNDFSGQDYVRVSSPAIMRSEEEIFDIGPETIASFQKIISQAATIFWSGPMGLFEQEKFSLGTKLILKTIAENHHCFSVAGGGDTIGAIKKFGQLESFSYICSGGGSMLAFLAGEEMPGLVALQN